MGDPLDTLADNIGQEMAKDLTTQEETPTNVRVFGEPTRPTLEQHAFKIDQLTAELHSRLASERMHAQHDLEVRQVQITQQYEQDLVAAQAKLAYIRDHALKDAMEAYNKQMADIDAVQRR